MEVDNLTQIRNEIELLDKDKQVEIFKIFKRFDVFYSENNNGIFINLTEVSSDVLVEVQKFIDYINKQEHHIEIVELQKAKIQNTIMNLHE